MDDVSDEAGASLSQSFGMDKADIFFGRTLKLTLGWKIHSHRSENAKKKWVKTRKALKIMDFRKYLNWSYTPTSR